MRSTQGMKYLKASTYEAMETLNGDPVVCVIEQQDNREVC